MVRLPPVLASSHNGARSEFRLASAWEYLGYALWLVGPLCVMLLAASMSVGPGRSVSLPGLGQIPETCTLHTQLGMDCPGCGLTRGFIHLAHGRVLAAWSLNPIAPFMFAYVAWQIPLALTSCWTVFTRGRANRASVATKTSQPDGLARSRGWLSSCGQYNQWLLIGLMLALLLRWGVRLVAGGLI